MLNSNFAKPNPCFDVNTFRTSPVKEIIFCGGSHSGAYALKSIQSQFDRVYIIGNNNPDILSLKRENDVLIDDFLFADCPYVFIAGHLSLITPELLSKKIFINVHGALLPKYRGLHASFWAIMNEEKELGITLHLVNEFMDAGDILTQYTFKYSGQTIEEINNAINNLILENCGKDIAAFIDGNIIPIPQDNDKALFGCKRNLDDCLIDFNWNNKTINLFFKALTYPYPLPRIKLKKRIYEVLEFNLIKREYFCAIGRVLNIDDQGIWIKTSEGFLVVSKIMDVVSGTIIDPRKIVGIGYRIDNTP